MYDVYRKHLNGRYWGMPVATNLPIPTPNNGSMTWTDTVQTGAAYEYRVLRKVFDSEDMTFPIQAQGFIYGGVKVALKDQRGTLILVVDERIVDPLIAEIAMLKKDLVGDGWQVLEIVWDPDGTGLEDSGLAVSGLKQAIKERYDPDGLFTVHHGVGSEDWSPDGFTRAP